METMDRYVELMENGAELDHPVPPPSPRRGLATLHRIAAERDGLPLDGAWRLDREVSRDLARRAEFVPPGGWRRLAALAAGCDVLDASRDAFAAGVSLPEESDDDDARRMLLEAFSRRLVPPTTAAGLFILLNIHPAWGVHLAHVVNGRSDRPDGVSQRGERLFPDDALEVVRETVFSTLAAVVATLRRLEPGRAYPVDALAALVDVLCGRMRRRGMERAPTGEGLSPFVGNATNGDDEGWRVTDFTTNDLLDAWLVPAGAAHRHNDGTFSLFTDAFREVDVGELTPEDQAERLSTFLSPPSQHDVA